MGEFTTASNKPLANKEPVSYLKPKEQLISVVPTESSFSGVNPGYQENRFPEENLQELYEIPNDTKLLGIEKKTWLLGSIVAVVLLITVGFVAYKKSK